MQQFDICWDKSADNRLATAQFLDINPKNSSSLDLLVWGCVLSFPNIFLASFLFSLFFFLQSTRSNNTVYP